MAVNFPPMSQSHDSGPQTGKARHTSEIARQQPGLAAALRRAESYLALNRRIAVLLPAELRGKVGVACIEDDCLIVAATTPELATRARLNAGKLLEAARRFWPSPLRRSRIIVVPGMEFKPD